MDDLHRGPHRDSVPFGEGNASAALLERPAAGCRRVARRRHSAGMPRDHAGAPAGAVLRRRLQGNAASAGPRWCQTLTDPPRPRRPGASSPSTGCAASSSGSSSCTTRCGLLHVRSCRPGPLSALDGADRRSARWAGFDLAVTLNDGFFMPLLFGLSGLFVRDGLLRKGAGAYLRARLVRLGLAFCVAELTLVPLAYSVLPPGGGAPVSRPSGAPRSRPGRGRAGRLVHRHLLLFDAAATLWFVLAPRGGRPRRGGAFAGPVLPPRPRLHHPRLPAAAPRIRPRLWFAVGRSPCRAAASACTRPISPPVLARPGRSSGRRRFGQPLARRCGVGSRSRWRPERCSWQRPISARRSPGGPSRRSPQRRRADRVLRRRLLRAAGPVPAPRGRPTPSLGQPRGERLRDLPAALSVVTWTQFGLLGWKAGAVAKGVSTFTVALAASWAGAALLRRAPLVGRVL